MRHGSLFSGIGGFDLAAEWMGWENVFHCEWNEFGQKILKYYWPNADSHSDITKTDFKKYEGSLDIISGGFPCQPFSLAGKRKGTDDERYLWHEMLRAVQEIKPQFVVAENVFGITNIDGGMVFEQVCLDLEYEGYEVQPFIIPACAKNAPHRRDRVWFIANAPRRRTRGLRNGSCKGDKLFGCECGMEDEKRTPPNPGNEGLQRWKFNGAFNQETQGSGKLTSGSTSEFYKNTDWQDFPTQSPICSGDDGLPTELDGITFSKWRNESIKAYGNAIVPQVAHEIFKAINKLKTL